MSVHSWSWYVKAFYGCQQWTKLTRSVLATEYGSTLFSGNERSCGPTLIIETYRTWQVISSRRRWASLRWWLYEPIVGSRKWCTTVLSNSWGEWFSNLGHRTIIVHYGSVLLNCATKEAIVRQLWLSDRCIMPIIVHCRSVRRVTFTATRRLCVPWIHRLLKDRNFYWRRVSSWPWHYRILINLPVKVIWVIFWRFRETVLRSRFTKGSIFWYNPLLCNIVLAGSWVRINFFSETPIVNLIDMHLLH